MKYRPEIDGLRTVAVLPVILFHADFHLFSGGFVGVDVFFVISGYLITSILIADLAAGHFSLLRFYERRARRILPALFLIMGVCVPFAFLWMQPEQFKDFGQSIIAVVFFVSNVLFWIQDDYFAAAAELKPLLHTWSLAVEEQFYIMFPLALWGLWRLSKRNLLILMLGLASVSLLMSEWMWRQSPSANFYLAPTRAWELLAGSVCAWLTSGRPQRSNNSLAALGLTLISFSIFQYDQDVPFPSAYALVPVLGAVLIILYAGHGTWTARLLSTRPFVGIGLVSYSAYLWHQPLFAFARLRSVEPPTHMLLGFLSVASLILAWATWKFVEQPFRSGQDSVLPTRGMLFATSGIIGGFFVVVGLTLDNEAYFRSTLTERQADIFTFVDYKASDEFVRSYRMPDCFYGEEHGGFQAFNKDRCLALDETKPSYLLIGDSHGAHLWQAIQDKYPELNILQATASGCRPLLPVMGAPRCTSLIEYVFGETLPTGRIDGVILSARWKPEDSERLPGTVAELKRLVDQVYVLGPTVEYFDTLPSILIRLPETGAETALVWPSVDKQVFETAKIIESAATAAGARYFEVAGRICHGQTCRVFTENGVPMAWDYGHFTLAGAREIVRDIDPLADARR